MGWERKRGKLEMLLRLLATGDAERLPAAGAGLRAGRRASRYVLTLDSDTGLPPGALRELVADRRAPAERAADRRRQRAASSPATASCSRAS